MNRVMTCSAVCGALLVLPLSASRSTAVTFQIVPFDEMVRYSGFIVEATVTRMTTEQVVTGSAPATTASQESSVLPRREQDAEPSQVHGPRPAPVPVEAEGGSIIVTRVTLRLERVIKGSHARTMQLRMPGGTYGDTTVTIPGLPTFQVGKSYLLFLKPDCEQTGVPVMGVNQGYFQIIEDPATRRRMLVDAESDYVIGVEKGRVIRQLKSEQTAARRFKTDPPHPAPGYTVVVPAQTPGARRYLDSTQTPLSPDELIEIVRRIPDWDKVRPSTKRGQEGRP